METSPARRDQRVCDGPNRSFKQLAVSRLPKLRGCDRRQEAYFSEWRHAVGRRVVDQHSRRGSIRLFVSASRKVGKQTNHIRKMDSDGYHAGTARTRLWILVVAQHAT